MPFRDLRSEAEIRRRWRRLARTLHPDAHPGDPLAEERFKKAHTAFQRAIARVRGVSFSRAEVPRSRWVCPSCDDTFTYGSDCPRCAVSLHDSEQGPAPCHHDPAVDALIRELDRPRRTWANPVPAALRPAVAAVLMMLFGIFHWKLGLYGSAVLFLGFAGFVLMLDGHERFRRWRPNAWERV